MDNYDGGDDEYGMMDWEKLSWREVISNVKNIVDVDSSASSLHPLSTTGV